jgi:hypothetical protein
MALPAITAPNFASESYVMSDDMTAMLGADAGHIARARNIFEKVIAPLQVNGGSHFHVPFILNDANEVLLVVID